MWFKKNRIIYIFLFLSKTLFLIVGLNIFLTSLLTIIKIEFKKNNLESEINLNIKKLKFDKKVQFILDIY